MLPRRCDTDIGEGENWPWTASRRVLRKSAEVDSGVCCMGRAELRILSRRRVRSIMSLKKVTAGDWNGSGLSLSDGLLEELLVLG